MSIRKVTALLSAFVLSGTIGTLHFIAKADSPVPQQAEISSLSEENKTKELLLHQMQELSDKQNQIYREHAELWNKITPNAKKIEVLLRKYNMKVDTALYTDAVFYKFTYDEKNRLLSDIEKAKEYQPKIEQLQEQLNQYHKNCLSKAEQIIYDEIKKTEKKQKDCFICHLDLWDKAAESFQTYEEIANTEDFDLIESVKGLQNLTEFDKQTLIGDIRSADNETEKMAAKLYHQLERYYCFGTYDNSEISDIFRQIHQTVSKTEKLITVHCILWEKVFDKTSCYLNESDSSSWNKIIEFVNNRPEILDGMPTIEKTIIFSDIEAIKDAEKQIDELRKQFDAMIPEKIQQIKMLTD